MSNMAAYSSLLDSVIIFAGKIPYLWTFTWTLLMIYFSFYFLWSTALKLSYFYVPGIFGSFHYIRRYRNLLWKSAGYKTGMKFEPPKDYSDFLDRHHTGLCVQHQACHYKSHSGSSPTLHPSGSSNPEDTGTNWFSPHRILYHSSQVHL